MGVTPFTDPAKGPPYWLRPIDPVELETHRRLREKLERLERERIEGRKDA